MEKINDQKVLRVSLEECGEKMVDLLALGKWYFVPDVANIKDRVDFGRPDFTVARLGVAERLKKVFELLPKRYGLLLDEPYRSYEYQKQLYIEAKEKGEEAYVSDPDVFSPHVTGGAIDLAIVDDKGLMIDVGNWFDYDETAHTFCKGLTETQKQNRGMLVDLMTKAGFVNYPYEWWHWSYGDKYWGFVTGNRAIYGPIKQ